MLSFADILVFLLIIIGIAYFYCKKSYNYWRAKNVPYKEPTFIFGNILNMVLQKVHPGKYFEKLYNEIEGPYFVFFAFAKPFLVLKDPNLIKRVLIKDFQSFRNRLFVTDEKIEPILSNALPGIKDQRWKALRSKLSPVFTSGKMKMMMILMKGCGENLKKYIETVQDTSVEVKELAAKYTTDVIASCAFGIDANSFLNEDSEFRVAGRKLFPTTPARAFRAFSFFFAPLLVKIFKFGFLDADAVNFLRGVFTETIDKREEMKVKRNDLVDILIELKNQETKDDEFKFYGDRLLAQAIIFFFAGHETTSSTIAFTLYELCLNKNIQGRLRNEIDEVIRKHGDLSYEALQDMKYLDMIVCETLRKYPLTPFLQRECSEDYKIPETGLVIEKGTPIIIPQHGLHWDPKYFPNPEKYDPERFSEKNKQKITSYVYLPFGDGPRNCIGERFGLMSSKLGIIYIIKDFSVEKSPQTSEHLIFEPAGILRAKDGIQLSLKKLKN